MEASAGTRSRPHFWGRSVGIGEPSPNKHFCKIDRREIDAKRQGVYHLALLATFVGTFGYSVLRLAFLFHTIIVFTHTILQKLEACRRIRYNVKKDRVMP